MVIETMDAYLAYRDYEGIYTRLDGREDQHINLTQWINTYYGETSAKAFPGHKVDDVEDLMVRARCFDFVNSKRTASQLHKGQNDESL